MCSVMLVVLGGRFRAGAPPHAPPRWWALRPHTPLSPHPTLPQTPTQKPAPPHPQNPPNPTPPHLKPRTKIPTPKSGTQAGTKARTKAGGPSTRELSQHHGPGTKARNKAGTRHHSWDQEKGPGNQARTRDQGPKPEPWTKDPSRDEGPGSNAGRNQ